MQRLLDLIKERRSIRNFEDKEVPDHLLQLILEDHGHDDADDANDKATKEGVPPDRFANDQPNVERLTDQGCQIKQESIDNQCEQSQRQSDQQTTQEFKQRADQCIDKPEDQCQPKDRTHAAFKVDTRHDQHRQIQRNGVDQ